MMRAPWRSSIKSSGYMRGLTIGAAGDQQVHGAGENFVGAVAADHLEGKLVGDRGYCAGRWRSEQDIGVLSQDAPTRRC
jgi:hypothetical protein